MICPPAETLAAKVGAKWRKRGLIWFVLLCVHGSSPSHAAEQQPVPGIAQHSVDGLLALRARQGSAWVLASLKGHPRVFVLQFPTLTEQGAAMNRIAALYQKSSAPRDRVLPDRELNALVARKGDNGATFFLGHDYTLRQVEVFFALSSEQGVSLNKAEIALRELLLANTLIGPPTSVPTVPRAASDMGAGADRALVTFTNTQPDEPSTPHNEQIDETRRRSVLLHELSHGRFYTDPYYHRLCWAIWNKVLTAAERRAVRLALGRSGYDLDNMDLVVNEAQALLFHTPDPRAFQAFSFGMTDKRLKEVRLRFARAIERLQR